MNNVEITLYSTLNEDFNDYFDSDVDLIILDKLKTNINRPCVIYGTLGLWNGEKEIIPMKCFSITKAINMCIRNMDDVEIKFSNGKLKVYGYHHDGVNELTIAILSSFGIHLKKPYNLSNPRFHSKMELVKSKVMFR